jgi:hypothetical protein
MQLKNKKFITALIINLLLLVFLVVTPVVSVKAIDELKNPLAGSADIDSYSLFARIIKAALGIAGSLSLVFFVWGGMIWMTAGGNEEKTKKAKDTLIWSVLGLVAIFASYAILSAIIRALSSSTYGSP